MKGRDFFCVFREWFFIFMELFLRAFCFPAVHQFFNCVRVFRHFVGQIDIAVFGHQNVVFDADADAAIFGGRVFIVGRNV